MLRPAPNASSKWSVVARLGPRRAFALALVVAIDAVAIVLIFLPSGHHSSPGANQQQIASRSRAAAPVALAAGQPPRVTPSTTATTSPTDPYLQPSGSALPLLCVFDGSTVYLRGAVPSAAIAQYLSGLAKAYSKTPNPQVVSNLVVDPRVPTSTGVRVIEMNSVRFASGSSQITPEYAPELSRVVTILKAMPKLTALVIGHADQTGNSAQNLSLSEARAIADVEYLVAQGISPERLTAQGVGDTSLLTQQSNAAGLTLNRRTEFIFYGLMTGP
ncbi:MAG: OmpA family protein [Acidimicrobiaceae bacterium]|nr:OmpA family protein [Acidimicrobiaceae bacterium]